MSNPAWKSDFSTNFQKEKNITTEQSLQIIEDASTKGVAVQPQVTYGNTTTSLSSAVRAGQAYEATPNKNPWEVEKHQANITSVSYGNTGSAPATSSNVASKAGAFGPTRSEFKAPATSGTHTTTTSAPSATNAAPATGFGSSVTHSAQTFNNNAGAARFGDRGADAFKKFGEKNAVKPMIDLTK